MPHGEPREGDRVRFVKGPRGVKGKYGWIQTVDTAYRIVVYGTGGSVFSVPKGRWMEWFYSLGPSEPKAAELSRVRSVRLVIR